jgi:hypothetical protein
MMSHGNRDLNAYASDASMTIGGHELGGPTVGLHTVCVDSKWRAKGLETRIYRARPRELLDCT